MNTPEIREPIYLSAEESAEWKRICKEEEKDNRDCLQLIADLREAFEMDDREDVLEYFGDLLKEWSKSKFDSKSFVAKFQDLLSDVGTYCKHGASLLWDSYEY